MLEQLFKTFSFKSNCLRPYLMIKYDLTLFQVTNVHRVVQFRQKPWMKEYIEYNTRQRAQAASEFEKEFYKLMNNR